MLTIRFYSICIVVCVCRRELISLRRSCHKYFMYACRWSLWSGGWNALLPNASVKNLRKKNRRNVSQSANLQYCSSFLWKRQQVSVTQYPTSQHKWVKSFCIAFNRWFLLIFTANFRPIRPCRLGLRLLEETFEHPNLYNTRSLTILLYILSTCERQLHTYHLHALAL